MVMVAIIMRAMTITEAIIMVVASVVRWATMGAGAMTLIVVVVVVVVVFVLFIPIVGIFSIVVLAVGIELTVNPLVLAIGMLAALGLRTPLVIVLVLARLVVVFVVA
jgi:hypothetical protein